MRQFDCEFDRTLAAGIELWKRKDCGKLPDGDWATVPSAVIWTPSESERAPCCAALVDLLKDRNIYYNHALTVVHIANLFATVQIQDMLRVRNILQLGYEPVIEQLWQVVKAIENSTGATITDFQLRKTAWELTTNPPVVEPAK